MEQPTFADVDYESKKRKTRREKFLERMDGLIPWERLEGRIRPFYPTAGRGRHPYTLSAMLRVHCVQLFYNLSDPGMEDLLYDVESVRRFVGLKLSEPMPDETTILHFRHLLEEHKLGDGLFGEINRHLASQGLRLQEGTIVDASIIEAPSSTKNRAGARDPEMHQVKKGNAWHFGMKVHIGVDAQTGVVAQRIHDGGQCERRDRSAPVAARGRVAGVGGCGVSGGPEAGGESGVRGGVAGGDAARPAPETGAGKPWGVGGEGQGVGASEGGAPVPICEAALWLLQGPLSWAGQEHATADGAAGADQLDDSRALPGGVTGARCVQNRARDLQSPDQGD